MRQPTRTRRDTLGKNRFGSFGLRDLVVAVEPAATPFPFALAFVLAARLLALFFGPQGKWLSELSRSSAPDFLLKFLDLPLGRLQLLLRRLELTLKAYDQIDKSFGAVAALDRVSFKVEDGSAHAIVAENGAGKSTLVKVL